MEKYTDSLMDKEAKVLTLTEEDLEIYLSEKQANGLTAKAVAKYRSYLQNLCKWLPEGKVITRERLLQWRTELENNGYSKFTIENYVTNANLYVKYRGRPDLNIRKTRAYELREKSFGYLTAIKMIGKKSRKDNVWLCRCKCGNEIEVPASLLVRGNTTSCGCLNIEILQYHNRYEEGTELRQVLDEKIRNSNSVSGYVGVRPHRDKWAAHITYKGKYYYLGTFSNIEDAIKARARAKEAVMEDATRIYEETKQRYREQPRRKPLPKRECETKPEEKYPARRNDNTSGYPGIVRTGSKWFVSIGINGCRYNLGRYESLDEAVSVRKIAENYALEKDMDRLVAMSRSITTYRK